MPRINLAVAAAYRRRVKSRQVRSSVEPEQCKAAAETALDNHGHDSIQENEYSLDDEFLPEEDGMAIMPKTVDASEATIWRPPRLDISSDDERSMDDGKNEPGDGFEDWESSEDEDEEADILPGLAPADALGEEYARELNNVGMLLHPLHPHPV